MKNKTKKRKNSDIVLVVICIVQFIMIFQLSMNTGSHQRSLERRRVIEAESPDSEHLIVISEEGETSPSESSKMILSVSHKEDNNWRGGEYLRFELANEKPPTSENFILEWIEEGVLIHVTAEEELDYTYRIYWDDVFLENES